MARPEIKRFLTLTALVIAGEMVFGLPFHTVRFFRPTLMQVFGFTNTEIGYVFAVYGVAAMVSYFPGGALADRYSARTLLSGSLITTGLGGLYMATLPGIFGASIVYGFWGVTTIFLFWGALIRATREWGGDASQGEAFGLLEAGRGIAAAVVASSVVVIFAQLLPDNADLATGADRRAAMRAVYLCYTTAAIFAGVLVWFTLPTSAGTNARQSSPLRNMLAVLRQPVIWAQAGIIIAAYCCYKSLDFLGLYAVVVLGFDEVQAAKLTSYGAYVRPVAAVAAGVIADRVGAAHAIGGAFAILGLTYLIFSYLDPEMTTTAVIFGNALASLFAVFALRGVYFALLQATRTPGQITGAAVGMISLVGFTPEIFFAWIAGVMLDATPGPGGFTDLFALLAGIAVVGTIVAAGLTRLHWRNAVNG